MKRRLPTFFLASAALLGGSPDVHATNLSGAITVDTLRQADSPFIVVGNISLSSTRTLVVEAGVTLKFNSGLNFTINGTLTAVGASGDSIRFTSNLGSPNSGDWNGLSFSASGAGLLQFVALEYAASAVVVTGSSPTIRNSSIRANNNGVDCFSLAAPLVESNEFKSNGNTGVRCNQSSPVIRNNRIFGNVAVSSAILCENSSPRISGNLIYGNDNAAIDCISGADPEIWQNTLSGNDFGITISDSSAPSVNGNIVVNHNNIGIAINDVQATPAIKFNDVWGNSGSDYFGAPAQVGVLTTTNVNGDSSDADFNISLDPLFANAAQSDYDLRSTSSCIDAGDPANPAGITVVGGAVDIGGLEYDDGALPVELVAFAFAGGVLKWSTASETDNFGFEVQRSPNEAGPFSKIGFVRGAGTTTLPRDYVFRDSVNSGTFFYRLKQIDLDGTFVFSAVVRVSYQTPTTPSLARNFPNPFNPETVIEFELNEQENKPAAQVELTVFNAAGRRVVTLLNERRPPGAYQIRWRGVDNSGRRVASGLYFYRLRYGKWVFTRSMLLVK